MGNRALISLAVLAAASASAQAPPQPDKRPDLFEELSRAGELVTAMLSSAKPASELATDKAFFTKRFREAPSQRGLAWKDFAMSGKPGKPAAFDGHCKASSTDALWSGLVNLGAASRSKGQPAPYACNLLVRCSANTTRETGCYEIDLDVCTSPDGEPRIDRVTGGRKYTIWGPAKDTPCTRAAASAQ